MTIYRDSQWQAGMEVNFGDLSNISRFLRSQVFDTLAGEARILTHDSAPDLGTLFASGNGGAVAFFGGLTISSVRGTIFQALTGTVTGADADFVPYYLAPGELETTFDAADPTLPRIDLVCVKIDTVDDAPVTRHFEDAVTGALTSAPAVPTRRTRITKVVVKGTPGAHTELGAGDGSVFPFGAVPSATPAMPAVPAGYVPWAGLFIPAGAASPTGANVFDFRVPLGARLYEQAGAAGFTSPADDLAGNTVRSGDFMILDNTGAYSVRWKCPAPSGRVLAIALMFNGAPGVANASHVSLDFFGEDAIVGGSSGGWELLDLTTELGTDGGAPISGNVALLRSHSNRKAPLWGGGRPSAYVRDFTQRDRLYLTFVSNGTVKNIVRSVQWLIAG